jgi:xylan 1,4-beta-xylosidase
VAIDYDFSDPLHPDFQWLRTPERDRIFRTGDGALTLIGRESLGSWFEQALVARRQQHLRYRAEATVAFAPETYQQAAGITTYYNRHKFHALVVTHEPGVGRVLAILSCPGAWPDGGLSLPLAAPVPIPDGPVDLAVTVDRATQRFQWRGGGDWQDIGPVLDASVISDEGGRGEHGSFTGAFVGVVAFDITGRGTEARVTRFAYAGEG